MNAHAPSHPLYTIYGLTLASELPLPELNAADPGATPDVAIRRGEVPPVWEVTDPLNLRSLIDGTRELMWLKITNTVRMLVQSGQSITYEFEPGGAADAARLFMLGSGMSTLLMQRGFVVVHGNAITAPGARSAIVCIGDSGAGKSTAAVGMTRRGFSILADDVCPIDPRGIIPPGMPRAKLWEETARRLAIDTAPLDRVRAGAAKFNLPLGEGYCASPRQVSAFVWLVPGEVDRVEVREVTGIEKFIVLRNNIYRPEYLMVLQLEADYLRQVAQIAEQTRIYKLVRPIAGFDLGPVLDAIAALHARAELDHAGLASASGDA